MSQPTELELTPGERLGVYRVIEVRQNLIILRSHSWRAIGYLLGAIMTAIGAALLAWLLIKRGRIQSKEEIGILTCLTLAAPVSALLAWTEVGTTLTFDGDLRSVQLGRRFRAAKRWPVSHFHSVHVWLYRNPGSGEVRVNMGLANDALKFEHALASVPAENANALAYLCAAAHQIAGVLNIPLSADAAPAIAPNLLAEVEELLGV